MENKLDLTDIVDLLASTGLWHSTGESGAGSKLLAALHDEGHEFSLLTEYALVECGERSLILIHDGLQTGAVSDAEATRVLAAMRNKPLGGNRLSLGFGGNA
jgi:hypothetical protein